MREPAAPSRLRAAAVVPALNEAASIASVVTNVRPYADVIVVDDGSSDRTGDLARQAGAEVVTHPVNRGYDGALDSGFKRAAELGYDFVVTLDADGQHDPARVATFLAELERGADLVVGVRPRTQRVSEKLFAAVSATLWGVRDPLCGMKAYRMTLYRTVGHFDSYHSIGTELLVRALAAKLKVTQIPVAMRDRAGAPRFGAGLRANALIFRAMLRGVAIYARSRRSASS